jgi:hypothetical protein
MEIHFELILYYGATILISWGFLSMARWVAKDWLNNRRWGPWSRRRWLQQIGLTIGALSWAMVFLGALILLGLYPLFVVFLAAPRARPSAIDICAAFTLACAPLVWWVVSREMKEIELAARLGCVCNLCHIRHHTTEPHDPEFHRRIGAAFKGGMLSESAALEATSMAVSAAIRTADFRKRHPEFERPWQQQ